MARPARLRRAAIGGVVASLTMLVTACSGASTSSPTGSSPGVLAGTARNGATLHGPLADLLADSTDLGPSRAPRITIVVALAHAHRPRALRAWADEHGLTTRWQTGDAWAAVAGPATRIGSALGVSVQDFRSRTGRRFYAATSQPRIPSALRPEVTQIGRVTNFVPQSDAAPAESDTTPGLTPQQLITAYDATALEKSSSGTTGTVVLYESGPFLASDLTAFSRMTGLPAIRPVYLGTPPSRDGDGSDETDLDIEAVHAVAPNARIVIVDVDPIYDGSTYASLGLALARLFTGADRQYPGAVWSLSLSFGCEALYTAADLAPVESALVRAESHGTSVFISSGDTAGLECKGGEDYSSPPAQSDVGVSAVAALPAITAVGGTRLETDSKGRWVSEQAWDYSALSQGGSGGVSDLQARPSWQVATGISALRGAGRRLLPDVSADADPDTGLRVVLGGVTQPGGGTSQAAPIWAGFATLMNDYLKANGGNLLGAINPLLYKAASGGRSQAFHDITLGGDAVDFARQGFDLVTGLGSPEVDNLVQDILAEQGGQS